MEILFKSGTGGSVRVFQPSKTVLLSVFAGNLAGEFVPPVLGAFDEPSVIPRRASIASTTGPR